MKRLAPGAALVFGAALSLYPFVWMVTTSFKSRADAMRANLSLWPETWQPENYAQTFDAAPFGRYFFNSFFVAGVTAAAVMLTALLAGYAFARLRFRGRNLLFGLTLASMMVPFEVALIPNFVIVSKLGWYNSYTALIVPWCANAFSVFLVRQAFMSMPDDFYHAAAVDGCGHLRFLFSVGAPVVAPALAAVGLFAFLSSYNALLWPLVVTGDESMRVVQVGLTVFATDAGVQVQLLMCAAVIVMLPTVLLYFFTQGLFVRSAAGLAIKV